MCFFSETLLLTRQRNDTNENFDQPQYVLLIAKYVDMVIEVFTI
jgi:hypothetical protein